MQLTEELRERLTKKRWIVLITSCLMNLCIGSLYAWSVFSTPMAEHLTLIGHKTVTVGDLAIIFTVANSVGPVTLISGGFFNDRFGPRWVVFAGGLFFGAGMFLSGMAAQTGMLLVGYGLGCGLGMGLVYGCTISNSVKFFPDKRGLIGGIATASYGISSVLIPPIAYALIERTGVTNAFKLFGIAFLLVICIGAFFIIPCPEGFTPVGFEPDRAAGISAGEVKNKSWRQMLADPIFYVMILMMTCGAVFGMMTISQASPIAQNMIGMPVASASIVVSVLALFNAAGRVMAGFVSDIIGRINTLTVMLILAVGGLLLLSFSGEGDVWKFYIGVSVVGLCFGSFMGVYPGFTADQFGPKNNSVNYGIMFIGFATAGYVGPTLVSKVYAADQSYQRAFLLALGLVLTGLLLSVVYRVLNRHANTEK